MAASGQMQYDYKQTNTCITYRRYVPGYKYAPVKVCSEISTMSHKKPEKVPT